MNVGKSVVIKGELHGSENLTIEGQVEGKIKAQVFAKALVVLGAVNDNIAVSEKGDIRDGEAASATVRRVREAAPGVPVSIGAASATSRVRWSTGASAQIGHRLLRLTDDQRRRRAVLGHRLGLARLKRRWSPS